jgi:hypothetical protein
MPTSSCPCRAHNHYRDQYHRASPAPSALNTSRHKTGQELADAQLHRTIASPMVRLKPSLVSHILWPLPERFYPTVYYASSTPDGDVYIVGHNDSGLGPIPSLANDLYRYSPDANALIHLLCSGNKPPSGGGSGFIIGQLLGFMASDDNLHVLNLGVYFSCLRWRAHRFYLLLQPPMNGPNFPFWGKARSRAGITNWSILETSFCCLEEVGWVIQPRTGRTFGQLFSTKVCPG